MKKNNKGIGLLELMLALAIIAILLVMATRYYMSASLNSRINQAADALMSLPAAGECWSSSSSNPSDTSGTYENLDLYIVSYTDKCYPTSLVNSSGALITPYGAFTPTSTASSISITLTDIPNQEAALLAAKVCQKGFETVGITGFTYEAITQTCT